MGRRTRFAALARRGILSLALAGLLLPWASGPASLARADDHEPDPGELVELGRRDPDARLEIIIKSVKVLKDRDPGTEGDFYFQLRFWRVNPGCPPDSEDEGCITQLLASAPMEFGADDGETVVLNRHVPDPNPGAWVVNSTIGPDRGIPVFDGRTYGMALHGMERDPGRDDPVGTLVWVLTAENKWDVGARTERGRQGSSCLPIFLPCDYLPGGEPADTVVEYEIRRMPLADLAPSNIRLVDAGEQQFHCVTVDNVGQRPPGLFKMAVRADEALVTTCDMPALGIGQTTERCIIRSNLPPGEHMLSFVVDEAREIAEMNERNNVYQHRIPAVQSTAAGPRPGAGPSTVADPGSSGPPSSQPGPANADLTVKAIRVRGDEPSGNNDCDPGKNDVTVVIRNDGTGVAADFAVRVVVDDEADEAREKAVATLDGNQELSVAFDDQRLGKGERRLSATVDANKTIAESDEDNNELRVTVRCQDEGD